MTTPNGSINGAITSVTSPYAQLQVPNAIDYTSKDFLGFVTSMLAYANAVMPDWNTNSEGDMGVMMVELMAYVGDILSYYGDRLTQEAYIGTATQRLSVLNIAQLLGYTPSNGIPASGTVTFQTDASAPNTVVPQGTQVATNQIVSSVDAPVVYETAEDIDVPGSGGTASVAVTQGITYSMVQVGSSDGTSGQLFSIPQTGVIDGSVSVFVQTALSSEEWNYINFLADAGPVDTVFATYTDSSGITWIQFGDNINGEIPGLGLNIWTSYTVGVGAAGNVAAGQVGVIVSNIPGVSIPLLGDGITYNSTAMTGGSDPETNDQIRANAPAAFATQQRAVSTQDFAALALNVPGVLMANAVANHSTSVSLYVLGPNYQAADTGLQNDLYAYFQGKTLAGVSMTVLAPNLIPVNVGSSGSNAVIQVAPNYAMATVLQQVTQALQVLLTPPSTKFGMLLTLSDIMGTVMSIPGVQWCTIPLFTREDVTQSTTNSIQFRQSEIPVPGSLFLIGQGGLGS